MNLDTLKLLITVITFFVAYLFSATIAGSFRAWVAHKMGDYTATSLGLLTANPIAHIDLFGLIMLLFFGFGWGKHVPINPFNIHQPYRPLKLVMAYMSDTFAYFISALLGTVILMVAFGPGMLFTARAMLLCMPNMTHLYLINECPTFSSASIVISFILIAFVYLNVLLAVLTGIMNT